MKKLLKVLSKDLISPYQDFQYELGKVYHCKNFDESNKDCSRGFYAVDFNGLSYAYRKDGKVYEVEVWGKEKEFNPFKRRYEYIKICRELTHDELIQGLLKANESEGYNVLESVFPVNPFGIEPKISVKEAVDLLEKWTSVRNSVGDSVGYSVWDSVGYSVGASVWTSVRNSVWDSVEYSVGASVLAYISSLFPNVKKWKYIDHEPGVNPFQPGIDLWRSGYIASFDGNKWRLHTKDGIVWEEPE